MYQEVYIFIQNTLYISLKLTYSYIQAGAKALKREEEYIDGIIFKGVDYARKIIGRGELIQIYNPKEDISSLPYQEYKDGSKDREKAIPTRYKVCVIGATIKLTPVLS